MLVQIQDAAFDSMPCGTIYHSSTPGISQNSIFSNTFGGSLCAYVLLYVWCDCIPVMYDHWFHHAGSQLTNVRHELDEFFWIVRHSVISPCHVLELGHQAFFFGLKWKTPWLRTISPIPVGHCQNHYGTMESGHYTAYCKNAIWYKFDDHDVSPISQGAVKTPAAYILYYMADDRIAERHR